MSSVLDNRECISSPDVRVVLGSLEVMPKEPYVPRYAQLLELCTYDLDIQELREHLERYLIEFNCRRSPENILRGVTGKCSRAQQLVLEVCQSLDRLAPITRYLFSRFAARKLAFRAIGSFALPYPSRLTAVFDDWILMAPYVEKLTTEMQRWRSGDGRSVFKANVFYARLPGFNFFSIDRYDTIRSSAAVEASLIYMFDGIPNLFVVPYLTPVEVICQALQATFGCRMSPDVTCHKVPLYTVIVQKAINQGLERDHFTDQLKELLHFQDHTLRRIEREPTLKKYPVLHCCPFNTVIVEATEGFRLVLRSKPDKNLLEVLYEKERNKEISVSEIVIKELVKGTRNVFNGDEFTYESSSSS